MTIWGIAWLALPIAPVLGQWLHYPTPGIPRLANGQPNLSAPVPRGPDGKPDLSGIWEHKNARTTAYYLDKTVIPWRPEAEALFKQNQVNNQKDNPEGQCLPRGLPKSDAFDLHKIVQTPGLIVVLYEYNTMYRQIFTDGRPLPVDANPSWMGQACWVTRRATGKATRWWWSRTASTAKLYSNLKASLGSIREARRAGK